jgi:hypothetical protein
MPISPLVDFGSHPTPKASLSFVIDEGRGSHDVTGIVVPTHRHVRQPKGILMKLFKIFDASVMCTASSVGVSLPSLLCLALAGTAQAAAMAPSAAAQPHAQWRADISSTPLPGSGCFASRYPSRVWTQVACRKAPDRRYDPAHGPIGFTVGDGHDYAAEVSGIIKSGVGSFPKITGLTTETNDGSSNTYSLQMNSQFFASPTCSGAQNPPDCLGWQQFIYSQDDGGAVFMQSWLIDYGSNCPSGWNQYSSDCYRNSNATGVSEQTLSNLHDLQLTGSAVSGGDDTVKLTTSNEAYSASESDTIVGLSGYWDAAEYNIFGDGGGSEADFNEGTKITVKIQLQDGSTAAPTCESNAGTTGETNNLNLGICSGHSATKPYIKFTESN